jgi:hypothetical protein
MYFVDVSTAVASVQTFFSALADVLPNTVHIQVQNAGDILESTTGVMTDTWTSDAVDIVDGGINEPYSAPSGAVVNWKTATITKGRRLKGKTFLVPLSQTVYAGDGTLDSDKQEEIRTAAAALVEAQSESLCIWHRGTGTDGTTGIVTEATVPDLAAILRSRRG